MKIFEIVQEAPNSDEGPLDAGRIRQLYKGKLGDFIIDAYNKPRVNSWSDAIDLGTAEYQEWLSSQERKDINRNKKDLEKERLKRKAGDQEKRGRGQYTHHRDGSVRGGGKSADTKDATPQKSYDIDTDDAIGSTFKGIKKKIGKALKKSIPGAQEIDTAKDLAIGGFKRGFNLAKSVPTLKKNR